MLDYAGVINYGRNQYGIEPEFPWKKFPEYAVLRHDSNRKWCAVVMKVNPTKFALPSGQFVDVINVKCEPFFLDGLVQREGFYRAYHMNKKQWLSIILDGTVPDEEIIACIDSSYVLTA